MIHNIDEMTAAEEIRIYKPYFMTMGAVEELLKYCHDNIEFMWAAKVTGIVLDCDFREAKAAIELHMKFNDEVEADE